MSIASPYVHPTPSNCAAPPRRHKQSRIGLAWLGAMFLLAGWSGIVAYREYTTKSVASASRADSGTERKPRQRRIVDMRTGHKVSAANPTGELDLSLGELIDPATWRNLVLVSHKGDHSRCDIELLRSLEWIAEHSAIVGGKVHISVPECGIDADADLLAIDPCPSIEPGEGRVVTGTFKHSSAHAVELRLAGVDDAIITTTNHLFWSEDRHEFVRADGLRNNEHLRGRDAAVRVASVTSLPGTREVYNLEVHLDHVFQVGSAGVLVHNGLLDIVNPCFVPAGTNVALGLRRIDGDLALRPFGDRFGAVIDEDWARLGLHNAPQGRFDIAFEQTLDAITARGGRIKFNLDSLDVAKALAGDPTDRIARYTEWELQQIIRKKSWFDATDFYLDGKLLTPEELQNLGIALVD